MVLVSFFGYLNFRFLKLQNSIGIMIVSILFSMFIIVISIYFPAFIKFQKSIVSTIDFQKLLLNGILSFMLFAGALHLDFNQLKTQKWNVLAFTTLGVILSTAFVGVILYYALGWVGLSMPIIHCLLFGALISPTDPVAVIGILKKAGINKTVEINIVGESLFNDGIGVVIFLTLLQFASVGNTETIALSGIIKLIFLEVIGGIAFGIILGRITHRAIMKIDSYETEVLITLGMVMGGYALAEKLGVSGPLTMVVSGLLIGNKTYSESKKRTDTQSYVFKFWELIDILCNAILFVLIGLEIVLISFDKQLVLAGFIAIPIVILARYLSVKVLVNSLKKWEPFGSKTSLLMTWGGLRGGISIAMALSLSKATSWDIIVPITYIVVVFSIIVQGLSLGRLVAFFKKSNKIKT
ncbi:cation:proton antiporter [Bizionia arctica]|nr:sodium:proton antiporter [Bizionia arctica]